MTLSIERNTMKTTIRILLLTVVFAWTALGQTTSADSLDFLPISRADAPQQEPLVEAGFVMLAGWTDLSGINVVRRALEIKHSSAKYPMPRHPDLSTMQPVSQYGMHISIHVLKNYLLDLEATPQSWSPESGEGGASVCMGTFTIAASRSFPTLFSFALPQGMIEPFLSLGYAWSNYTFKDFYRETVGRDTVGNAYVLEYISAEGSSSGLLVSGGLTVHLDYPGPTLRGRASYYFMSEQQVDAQGISASVSLRTVSVGLQLLIPIL